MADAGTATSFGDVSCSGADINDVLNTKTDYQDDCAYNGSFDQLKQLKNNNYIKVIKILPFTISSLVVLHK